MNELNEFKACLKADIQSLKKLEMATLPATDFYRPFIHTFLKVWLYYVLINTVILIITPHHQSFLKMMGENILFQGLLSIIPMLFIRDYIVFKNLIKNSFQSAPYFNHYLKIWTRLYFALYAVLFLSLIIGMNDFAPVFWCQFASIVLSLIISAFALNFELQRLGLSTLMETLSEVISKAKKAADSLQNEE